MPKQEICAFATKSCKSKNIFPLNVKVLDTECDAPIGSCFQAELNWASFVIYLFLGIIVGNRLYVNLKNKFEKGKKRDEIE